MPQKRKNIKKQRKLVKKAKLHKRKRKSRQRYSTNKEHDGIEISQHNDLSLKKLPTITFGRKQVKTIGTCLYSNHNQWLIESSQGTQGLDMGECNMTRAQLMGDRSDVISERVRWADDPFDFVIGPVEEPNFVFPGPFNLRPATDRYCLKTVDCTTEILSMVNIPMHVQIYWITPKFDTDLTPKGCWEDILIDKRNTQGIALPPSSVLDNSGIPGYGTPLSWNQSPWEHKEFRKAWRILCKERIVLQPGDQRKYSMKVNYNKVIERQEFLRNRTQMYLKDLTIIPMYITQGGMVGIELTPENTNCTRVAHGFTKLGTMTTYKMVFGNLPNPRVSSSRTYSGVIENANITTNVPRIINDLDVEATAIFT